MATSNDFFSTTIKAGADYSGTGKQYHAFAVADGQLANNAEEASGILMNKPADNAFAEIGYAGEMKFAAGNAIAKGGKVSIASSGWFTAADSYDTVVGESKTAVTSGSIGTGWFFFGPIVDRATAWHTAKTAKDTYIPGVGIALDDMEVADNGQECAGVATGAVSSGAAIDLAILGKVTIQADPAFCSSDGDLLTVTTSGYFIPCQSGYYACARALANIGSNATGAAFFSGPTGYQKD